MKVSQVLQMVQRQRSMNKQHVCANSRFITLYSCNGKAVRTTRHHKYWVHWPKIKWNRALEQIPAKIKVCAAVQLRSQGYSKRLASAYLWADLRQCNLYSKLRFRTPAISVIDLQRAGTYICARKDAMRKVTVSTVHSVVPLALATLQESPNAVI